LEPARAPCARPLAPKPLLDNRALIQVFGSKILGGTWQRHRKTVDEGGDHSPLLVASPLQDEVLRPINLPRRMKKTCTHASPVR